MVISWGGDMMRSHDQLNPTRFISVNCMFLDSEYKLTEYIKCNNLKHYP